MTEGLRTIEFWVTAYTADRYYYSRSAMLESQWLDIASDRVREMITSTHCIDAVHEILALMEREGQGGADAEWWGDTRIAVHSDPSED